MLAGVVYAGFGAVHPFCDAVFGFVAWAGGGFGDDGADGEILGAPGGVDGGGDVAKFFGEGFGVFEICVGQDEDERPGGVFHGDVGLADGGGNGAG